MPGYTSITWEFSKQERHQLVSRFYAAFMDDNLSFDGVFPWGCDPAMPYDEIVKWNQSKLDSDFTLGFTQDVSHDYRQIMLRVSPFSSCRVFLMNLETRIEFHCIVPEDEITLENCGPILQASLRTWSQLPVLVIESFGEIDANVGSFQIASGKSPSTALFALVDQDYGKFANNRDIEATALQRGCLLRRKGA
ncbi:MAG: hypothetical protein R3B84_10120 [Zavarzinella sp.]